MSDSFSDSFLQSLATTLCKSKDLQRLALRHFYCSVPEQYLDLLPSDNCYIYFSSYDSPNSTIWALCLLFPGETVLITPENESVLQLLSDLVYQISGLNHLVVSASNGKWMIPRGQEPIAYLIWESTGDVCP